MVIQADVDFNDTNKNSSSYQQVEKEVKEELKTMLVDETTGVVDVNILNLRKGSVIVQAEAVLADNGNAKSSLVSSLIKITRSTFTIGNRTGSAKVEVAGIQLSNASSPCSILKALGSCVRSFEICVDATGQAVCRETGQTDPQTLKYIIAPAVVGGVLLLAAVIASLVYFCRGRYCDKTKKLSYTHGLLHPSHQPRQTMQPARANSRRMCPTGHSYDNLAYSGYTNHRDADVWGGQLSGRRAGDPRTKRDQQNGVPRDSRSLTRPQVSVPPVSAWSQAFYNPTERMQY